jgi:hypothetical protein
MNENSTIPDIPLSCRVSSIPNSSVPLLELLKLVVDGSGGSAFSSAVNDSDLLGSIGIIGGSSESDIFRSRTPLILFLTASNAPNGPFVVACPFPLEETDEETGVLLFPGPNGSRDLILMDRMAPMPPGETGAILPRLVLLVFFELVPFESIGGDRTSIAGPTDWVVGNDTRRCRA